MSVAEDHRANPSFATFLCLHMGHLLLVRIIAGLQKIIIIRQMDNPDWLKGMELILKGSIG